MRGNVSVGGGGCQLMSTEFLIFFRSLNPTNSSKKKRRRMENNKNDYIGHVILIAIILRYVKDNRDGEMALCVKVSTSKPVA